MIEPTLSPKRDRSVFVSHARAERVQRGLTLIELMVAIAIAMFILLVATGMLSASSSTEKSNVGTSELATNGRYALDAVRREILHAGFKGLTVENSTVPSTAVPVVANDCGQGFAINVEQIVWGANDQNPFARTCIPAANYLGGDVLATWRLAVEPTTVLSTTTLYYRSAYDRGEVFLGSTPPPLFVETPQQDHSLEAHVFYISPYTTSPDENPRIPALYQLTLGAGPTLVPQLVASNVENLQVQYGRTITGGGTRYYNANDISSAASPGEWADVKSVRIWLMMRSSLPETGLKGSTTFVMGDQKVTYSDGYKRDLLSTIVQLRNNW